MVNYALDIFQEEQNLVIECKFLISEFMHGWKIYLIIQAVE